MTDTLEAILRRVAAGDLTPEQALPLLDAATTASGEPSGTPGSGTPGEPAPAWGTAPTPSSSTSSSSPMSSSPSAGGPETETTVADGRAAVRDVRISVSYRSIDVVADASVDQVAVSGGHSVRRDGDTLVVESTHFDGFTGFDERPPGGAWSFLPRSAAWARAMKGGHLTVRVNPQLPITIDSAGAALRVTGCEGGARIRAVAASLTLDRVRGPLEIDALSSSVKGTAAVTGASRISAESASVKLTLLPGSDVRVSAGGNRLGKIVLRGRPLPGPTGEGEPVIGDGSGRLTVDGVMSSVVLTAG